MHRFPSYTEISSFRNVLIEQRESSFCTYIAASLVLIIYLLQLRVQAFFQIPLCNFRRPPARTTLIPAATRAKFSPINFISKRRVTVRCSYEWPTFDWNSPKVYICSAAYRYCSRLYLDGSSCIVLLPLQPYSLSAPHRARCYTYIHTMPPL